MRSARHTLLLLLALAPGAAGEEGALSLSADGGLYRVNAGFQSCASSSAIWSVLTDYEELPSFIRSLKASRILERRPEGPKLEQVASAKAFLFSRNMKVLLDVREVPGRSISFSDVLGEDFDLYAGSWTLTAAAPFSVGYSLTVKHRGGAPRFAVKALARRDARRLLEDVRREISRRAPEAPDSPPCTP